MVFFKSGQFRLLLKALLAVWALFIIFLYMVQYHRSMKDVTLDIPRLFQSLFVFVIQEALWAVVFLAVGYALGRMVLDLLRTSAVLDTPEDDLLFSTATGWGLIGLGSLLLGSLGLLQNWLHIGLGIATLAVLHKKIIALVKRFRESLSAKSDMSTLEIFLIIVIGTVALWGLGPAFNPDIGFDSLNSHLPAPTTYIEEGRISFHPEINFNNFPQTVEMWFMQSFLAIPTGAATLIMAVCHLLTTLTIFAMARRFFGRGAGLTAALVYMFIQKVFYFTTVAYIDQGLALMIVLGIYAVFRYIETPSRSLAVLVGLCLGFACGIKYSAFITVLILALVAVGFDLYAKRDFRRLSIDLLIAAIILIAVCCPWYIRNWVWFHNPVFPFYPNLFPEPGGTYASLVEDLKVDQREMLKMFRLDSSMNAGQFLLIPFSMVFKPFGPYDAQGVGSIGPWFLITLPLILLLKRIPRILWAMAAVIIGTYAYWWFGERMLQLRYMLPIFSVQAVIAGILGWEGLKLGKLDVRSPVGWFALSILFLILVTYFIGFIIPLKDRGKMPIYPEERLRHISQGVNGYPAVERMNEYLAEQNEDRRPLKDIRVYGFYMEQVRWYSDFTLIGNQVGYADHEDYLDHTATARDLSEWLKSYGCEYLIINIPYASEAIGMRAAEALPSYMGIVMPDAEEYFDLIDAINNIFIFKIRDTE